jgi:cytidine deaminase, homotetrameric
MDSTEKLITAARTARNNSYSPYSHFPVGAAVECADGTIYSGCNIENASYGLCNCAERTAIFKAVSEGHHQFKAIAIIADTEFPCPPCGACRQVIGEFAIPKIIMANIAGQQKIVTLDEILPYAFGSSSLNPDK